MKIPPSAKLVFIGDSITDCERTKPVGEGLFGGEGKGYVALVKAHLTAARPADRIRVVADGGGLAGDGVADAFFQFTYSRPAAPALTIAAAAAGQARISWPPAPPGFVLQESWSVSPAAWTNSVSGATNPVVVPATASQRFFRLAHP